MLEPDTNSAQPPEPSASLTPSPTDASSAVSAGNCGTPIDFAASGATAASASAGSTAASGAPVPPAPSVTNDSSAQTSVKKKKSRKPLVISLVIVAILVLCAIPSLILPATANISANNIGIITINGTIGYDGSASSPEGLKKLLDQAQDDPTVQAVVLRVDSGGGSATAGEEMAHYVKEFKKPVVVSSGSMNASAAYEISAQAQKIYVNKTTAIGGIGTVMQVHDLSRLLDKLGISVENIASVESKDSSYGTRPLTDAERTYYRNLINELNDTFLQNVADGRHLPLEKVRSLATGMPFAGTTAVKNGIADELGGLSEATSAAAALANCSTYTTKKLELDNSSLFSLKSLLKNEVKRAVNSTVNEVFRSVKESLNATEIK